MLHPNQKQDQLGPSASRRLFGIAVQVTVPSVFDMTAGMQQLVASLIGKMVPMGAQQTWPAGPISVQLSFGLQQGRLGRMEQSPKLLSTHVIATH